MKKIFRKFPASNSSKFEGSGDGDGDGVDGVVGDCTVDDDVVDSVGVNHKRSSNRGPGAPVTSARTRSHQLCHVLTGDAAKF